MRKKGCRVFDHQVAVWSLKKLLHHQEKTTIVGTQSIIRSGRTAALLWLALEEIAQAKGSVYITPTRAILADLTGIERLPTISHALTVLHNAGWIEARVIPKFENGVRTASFLSIVLRKQTVKLKLSKPTKPHTLTSESANRKPASQKPVDMVERVLKRFSQYSGAESIVKAVVRTEKSEDGRSFVIWLLQGSSPHVFGLATSMASRLGDLLQEEFELLDPPSVEFRRAIPLAATGAVGQEQIATGVKS